MPETLTRDMSTTPSTSPSPNPSPRPNVAKTPAPTRRRNPYTAVLAVPGALRFSAAAVVARLPMSMVGIGTVLMIQGMYGSYALAGRVSAALVVAQALGSPQLARLVDRYGQRRVMLPMLAATTLGLAGLVITAVTNAPEALLYVFAVIAGATAGSYGSMVRARWSNVVDEPRRLHTAYSLESVLDEVVFVIGPVTVTLLATTVTPWSGLILPLVAAVVGGLWFLSQRSTEPAPIPRHTDGPHRSALLNPVVAVVCVVFVALGCVFGATDVSTIAFATEHGVRSASGAMLAVFALGSFTSGLLYGARHWRSALWKRFVIGMVLLAVGVSLFQLAHSVPVLLVIMFVTGLAIAPTLVNGNALIQQAVEPGQLTEGLAWAGTALGVGVSVGSAIAGSRIDAAGAHGGYHVVLAAGVLAVVVTLATVGVLRRRTTRAAA
ncbi:MFS transporter [Luteimicrobium subarcticum]|uniref:Putative MFS family arabinose efflux permease n=1 Tax=Luteimicrobium subarcticum TaxID=620910 RepID=A0A2M8W759_9MICO|nr:MFS transporter [Luteimicrobium subarcticum]PJI86767.1 putative MFS family arabinose efflux permease [Luteimicrobium subarcticum]